MKYTRKQIGEQILKEFQDDQDNANLPDQIEELWGMKYNVIIAPLLAGYINSARLIFNNQIDHTNGLPQEAQWYWANRMLFGLKHEWSGQSYFEVVDQMLQAEVPENFPDSINPDTEERLTWEEYAVVINEAETKFLAIGKEKLKNGNRNTELTFTEAVPWFQYFQGLGCNYYSHNEFLNIVNAYNASQQGMQEEEMAEEELSPPKPNLIQQALKFIGL